jgi:deazaflavin-dependent oxidoreductase (nitroreductase family)
VTGDDDQTLGEQLAAWGKVALLETRGRASGRPVTTPVGFVEEPDGSLLVAAASEASDWARNLRADPICRATIEEFMTDYEATEVAGPRRGSAVSALILKYGTPAERLGHGPVFRLKPRS